MGLFSLVSLALQIALDPNDLLREQWEAATRRLAQINPAVLQRVAAQIRLSQEDSNLGVLVAGLIEDMLEE